MFRKARNRLLLVNMVILTVVMLAAFVAVYLMTYTNIRAENTRRLEALHPFATHIIAGENLSIDGAATGSKPEGVGVGEMSDEEGNAIIHGPGFVIGPGVQIDSSIAFTPSQTLSFILVVDENNELQEVFSRLNLTEGDYRNALEQMNSTGSMEGTVKVADRLWFFSVISTLRVEESGATSLSGKTSGFGGTEGSSTITNSSEGPLPAESMNMAGWSHIAFLDITDSTETLTRLSLTLALVAALMLAVLFAVSRFVANRAIRPLEESWEKQRQFVADASHELKTPLAIIDANREALLLDKDSLAPEQRKWLNNINTETNRMNGLVAQLLYLSRMEEEKSSPTPCDLYVLATEALTSVEVIFFEKGIKLESELASEVSVMADPAALRQTMLILLDNAARYTPTGGVVRVLLASEHGMAVLRVTNNPAFIPAESLESVFERFYRADPSHEARREDESISASDDRPSGGFGLGLPIAKAIVERAGGMIEATSSEDTVAFTVMLKQV